MQFLVFALTYPIIWMFSKLPMRVLYMFSDLFFLLMYYLIGYRKKVVMKNISYAFPNKTTLEKKRIAKRFFRHFTDLFMESVKAFSITEKEIKKRYRYKNPEVVNSYAKEGRSIALVGAHQANWEWSISLPLPLDIKVSGAYTKLQNKYFEKVVRTSREKFGVIGYKTSDTVKGMAENYKNNFQSLYILLSDQSPMVHKTHYWQNFFGVKVPVHTGAEMLSKKFDLVVINYVSKKIKRGYYEVEFELITDNPRDFKDYEITDRFLQLTESNIQKQPEFYLWSHNRFKHKDKYEQWLEMRKNQKKGTK